MIESGKDIAKLQENDGAAIVERVVLGGDLSHLTSTERLHYYQATCESLKLNPLTKPFDYLQLDDKLVLYAKRDCTDQLRKVHDVSVKIVDRDLVDGVYTVKAQAKMPNGREDESVGAVPLVKELGEWKRAQSGKPYFQGNGQFQPLSPNDRANAIMKAETKAKRRVTLSICGLGLLDESELDTLASRIEPPIDTGGHPVGTQAAADYVRDRKLAAPAPTSTNNPSPGPANTAPPPPAEELPGIVQEMYKAMSTGSSSDKAAGFARVFGGFHDTFVRLQGDVVGVETYLHILGLHGVDSWQNFRSVKSARQCVLAMYKAVESVAQEQQSAVDDQLSFSSEAA